MYISKDLRNFVDAYKSNRDLQHYSTMDLANYFIAINAQVKKYNHKTKAYLLTLTGEDPDNVKYAYAVFQKVIDDLKETIYQRLINGPTDRVSIKILSILNDMTLNHYDDHMIDKNFVFSIVHQWMNRDNFDLDVLRPSFESRGKFFSKGAQAWIQILIEAYKKDNALKDEIIPQIEIHLKDGLLKKEEVDFYIQHQGQNAMWSMIAQSKILYDYDFHKQIDRNFVEPIRVLSESTKLSAPICAMIHSLNLCNYIYSEAKKKEENVKYHYFSYPIRNLSYIFSIYKLDALKPMCAQYMESLHGEAFDKDLFFDAEKYGFDKPQTVVDKNTTIGDVLDNLHPEVLKILNSQVRSDSELDPGFDTDAVDAISIGSLTTSTLG